MFVVICEIISKSGLIYRCLQYKLASSEDPGQPAPEDQCGQG